MMSREAYTPTTLAMIRLTQAAHEFTNAQFVENGSEWDRRDRAGWKLLWGHISLNDAYLTLRDTGHPGYAATVDYIRVRLQGGMTYGCAVHAIAKLVGQIQAVHGIQR